MNRRLIAALFLATAALNAAAQRVTLEAPLSPTPSLSAAAAVSPLAQTFPLTLSPWSPGLTATAIPMNAVPIPSARVQAVPAALAPTALAAARPVPAAHSPKVIDSLRQHGGDTGRLAELKGEAGAGALERNFMSAASLDDGLPAASAGDGARLPVEHDSRPLLARMLERVRLDDRGREDEKKALEDSFKRLLATPTGRRYAEEFLTEGLTAHVHFEDFPDSQLYLVDGRKKFYAGPS